MSFCSFSKEFNENAYTEVENRFIAKYLPEADGFAVKVYLYGLYLCQKPDADFGISAMAEVLKTSVEKIEEAFLLWQDYDLVEILSRDPFVVNYLSARTVVGRPKRVRYEQYADFNKELLRCMQQVKKDVSYNDSVKYMRFLEENEIQPQAFLLIAEYCIHKQGEKISPSYIFNKAKQYVRNGLHTYEQVERELSSYNANEKYLLAVFAVLFISRKPDDADYALYKKWTDWGFSHDGVLLAAKSLKRGSMDALNLLLEELYQKNKTDDDEAASYLDLRAELSALTFKIARKLGVKMGNPTPYMDAYVEKWYACGFEERSLCDLAFYCLKTDRADFASLDELCSRLFKNGVVGSDSVNDYLAVKNDELKLFTKIQNYCGNLKKSANNLSLVETWRSWNFSDEMILEAAKRSAGSAAPVPYINKILSDWKRVGAFKISDIPEKTQPVAAQKTYENPNVQAINEKTDRERYYFTLREKARRAAEKYQDQANKNPLFKENAQKLARMEISLAKAEISDPQKLPELQKEKLRLLQEKNDLLKDMGITEEMLRPKFCCEKCSDTGFLKSGAACDCYKKNAL